MQIVVLVKPVPDPAAGGERLGADGRLDRAATPAVVNANDEYALEAALKLVEAHGGEVTIVSMAPTNGPETMRKALAMGAHRGIHVTDEALAGSDHVSTARVLAAALKDLEYDLVLAGADTSDGLAGVVPAGVAALLAPAVPVLRGEDRAGYGRRPRPGPTHQPDRLRRPRGADAGPRRLHPGPRRAALPVAQGDHGRPLEGDRDEGPGRYRRRRRERRRGGGHDEGRSARRHRRPAAATRVVRESPDVAAREVVEFLAQRRIV